MTQNEGTLVIAPIRPWDSLDVYPSVYCNEALGGLHSVADTSSRNLITAERRQEGMLCYTTDSQKLYQLVGGTANANWAELVIGTGSSDQNLWETFTSDSGSATASSTTDTFSFSGTDGITTKITGDNLIIGYTGSTGSATDELVKASATDTNSNYLLSKLTAGSNITLTLQNTGSDEYIEIASTASGTGATTFLDLTDTPAGYLSHSSKLVSVNSSEDGLEFTPRVDDKFKISALDTGSGYFLSKITAGAGISFTIANPTANATLTIDADITSSVTDHGALTGLADDDHTQYLHLSGRTGGQTAYGGSTNSGDLFLYANKAELSGGAGMVLYDQGNSGHAIFEAGLGLSGVAGDVMLFGGNPQYGTGGAGGNVYLLPRGGYNGGADGNVYSNYTILPTTHSTAHNIGATGNGQSFDNFYGDRFNVMDTNGFVSSFEGSTIQTESIHYIMPTGGALASTSTYYLKGTFADIVGGGKVGYLDWEDRTNWGVPVGTILPFAGTSSLTGYLMCTGGSYTTASYYNLYSVIGYIYGGLGPVFNVPNLKSRFPMGGTGSGIGTTGGATTYNLSNHSIANHSIGDHSIADHNYNANLNHNVGVVRVPQDPQDQEVVQSIGDHSFSLSLQHGTLTHADLTHADLTHPNIDTIPPYLTINYLIKY